MSWKSETEGSEVHSYPWPYREFKTSLDYIKPYLKNKKKKKKNSPIRKTKQFLSDAKCRGYTKRVVIT